MDWILPVCFVVPNVKVDFFSTVLFEWILVKVSFFSQQKYKSISES